MQLSSSILNLLPARIRKHLPTATNPAYCSSCGLLPQDVIDHNGGKEYLGYYWSHLSYSQPLSSPSLGTSELKAVYHAVSSTSSRTAQSIFSAGSLHKSSGLFLMSEHIRIKILQLFLLLLLPLNLSQLKTIFTLSLKTDISWKKRRRLSAGEPSRTPVPSSHSIQPLDL